MDTNVEFILDKRLQLLEKNLAKNNINMIVLENKEMLNQFISQAIEKDSLVSFGGSATLSETGVLDNLRSMDINLLDRYDPSLSPEQIKQLHVNSFGADYYLSSANAISVEGEIYNVDGNGNRVAAIIYGPKKVFIIAGINKLVNNMHEAIERNRQWAAPINAKRLNRKTPCAETGYCSDCNSPDRICCNFVTITRQVDPRRMTVIILKEEYGF